MLDSLKEERSRHFKLALRIAIPVLVFIGALIYGLTFRKAPIDISTENIVIFLGAIFAVVYFIFFILDLSRRESLIDMITDSYHYDAFMDHLKAHHPKTLAVVYVNNFGEINENFGVSRADNLLKTLVYTIDKELLKYRKGFIGRRMGSEILIAVDDTPKKIDTAIKEFKKRHQIINNLDIELSYAVIENNIEDPQKSIEQLRNILIQKNMVYPISTKEPEIANAKKLTKDELSIIESLENERIHLLFRPLKNMKSGIMDLYEVGVFMKKENGEKIFPKSFLPIINRNNLGDTYDFLLVKKIVSIAKLVDENISFSFNLSPYSLRQDSFLEKLFKEVEKSGISPSRLIIELYERNRYHNLDRYFDRLKILKLKGFKLGLDNFGSSNASIEYLRLFPFDMIQLDREYTKEVDNPNGRAIVKSFITMAHDMNMLTSAKWVDNPKYAIVLKEIGIDYIQGYVVSRVIEESNFISELNSIKGENK